MGNRYTGNRYVPKVMGVDDGWSNTNVYEALTVVCWQGASYTSRQAVPVGVDISNKDYWACTGNYDAQVEQYRNDTNNAIVNVNSKLDNFANTQDGVFQVMLDGYKTQINSFAQGKYDDIQTQVTQTNNTLASSVSAIENTMTEYEASVQQSISDYTNTVNNQIVSVQTLLTSLDLVYDAGTSTTVDGSDLTIIDGGSL